MSAPLSCIALGIPCAAQHPAVYRVVCVAHMAAAHVQMVLTLFQKAPANVSSEQAATYC